MVSSILIFNQINFLQVPEISQRAFNSLDTSSIILIALILPNLLIYPVHPIPYAAHLWSIGIEEQFYLVQPFLIKFIKDYRVQIVILLMVLFSKELLSYFLDNVDSKYYHRAASQLVFFGSIAIGSISAILYLKQRKLVQLIIYNKYVQICAYLLFLLFLILIYRAKNETVVDFRLQAVVFAILVLNVSTNPLSIIKVKNKFLAYLGKISYGIYMYHAMAIGLAIAITNLILRTSANVLALNTLIYLLTFMFAFLLPVISFKYYEGYFLKLKKRYEI